MTTLVIETGLGTATLTYSEVYGQWQLFSGNVDKLVQMCDEMGYDYQKTGLVLADWVAANKKSFIIVTDDTVTVEELWANETGSAKDEFDTTSEEQKEITFTPFIKNAACYDEQIACDTVNKLNANEILEGWKADPTKFAPNCKSRKEAIAISLCEFAPQGTFKLG